MLTYVWVYLTWTVVVSVGFSDFSCNVTVEQLTPLCTATVNMCSLVEIKNPNEIYIHYLFDDQVTEKILKNNLAENTSDRGDSIDSIDNSRDVTINNCNVNRSATNADIAVQVDIKQEKGKHKEGKVENLRKRQNKATLTKGNGN